MGQSGGPTGIHVRKMLTAITMATTPRAWTGEIARLRRDCAISRMLGPRLKMPCRIAPTPSAVHSQSLNGAGQVRCKKKCPAQTTMSVKTAKQRSSQPKRTDGGSATACCSVVGCESLMVCGCRLTRKRSATATGSERRAEVKGCSHRECDRTSGSR
jgi:hypothetical protein